MKIRINGKEIDTVEICDILSFLFDKTIKKCSYSINNNKHWIEFEIAVKKPLERQEMNILTITKNEKIKKLQEEKEFSPLFLESCSNEINETLYRYNFKSIRHIFLYPHVVIDLYPHVVIEPLSKELLKKL